MERERVPVTILTGFLGSGKTTLLNHILTATHGKKIAIIENEFGDTSIDDKLIAKNRSSLPLPSSPRLPAPLCTPAPLPATAAFSVFCALSPAHRRRYAVAAPSTATRRLSRRSTAAFAAACGRT